MIYIKIFITFTKFIYQIIVKPVSHRLGVNYKLDDIMLERSDCNNWIIDKCLIGNYDQNCTITITKRLVQLSQQLNLYFYY